MRKLLKKLPEFKKEKILPFAGLAILFYALIMVSKAIYKNYSASTDFDDIKREVEELKEENSNLKNKISYYKTDVYKERQARAKLDLMKPGEHVIIITEPKTEEVKEEIPSNPIQAVTSNPEKWFRLFFKN